MKEAASPTDSSSKNTLVNAADPTAVWRKFDLYILPVVSMFYFLSFLVSICVDFGFFLIAFELGSVQYRECSHSRLAK